MSDAPDSAAWLRALRGEAAKSDKDWYVSLALSFFLGFLGADRFYLGYGFLGLMKLFSFGFLGVWWLVDVFLIFTGAMKDAEGQWVRRPE